MYSAEYIMVAYYDGAFSRVQQVEFSQKVPAHNQRGFFGIFRKSEDITLEYYKSTVKHKLKKNLTPVTRADIKCEKYLLGKIKSKFPMHDILAEESGEQNNNSEFKWIVDPIDGTKNFMRRY